MVQKIIFTEQKRHFFSPKDKFPTSSKINSKGKEVRNDKFIHLVNRCVFLISTSISTSTSTYDVDLEMGCQRPIFEIEIEIEIEVEIEVEIKPTRSTISRIKTNPQKKYPTFSPY